MALLEKTVWEVKEEFELRIPMTYNQFLSELGEDVHAEWVNGETILFMPPKPSHQRVVGFLLALIRLYVEHFELGEVLTAPIEMKPTPNSNSREPDILFVAKENRHLMGETKLEGPADLVVEIISPESIKRDTDDKLLEYEAEGVREYWIIDSRDDTNMALFYVLDDLGKYQKIEADDAERYYSKVLPDFWINSSWLRTKPHPNALECFAEVIGLPQEIISALQQSKNR